MVKKGGNMRGIIRAIVEMIPIVIVWVIITIVVIAGFLHAIGLWPEGWRF